MSNSSRPCGDKKHHPNATDPYTDKRMREMMGWELEEKIKWSKRKLLTELKKSMKPVIAFSGGKSSEVVLHLALSFNSVQNIEVIYNETGVSYPETTPFVKRLAEEWDFNLTITEPRKTFFECVEEYGWPEPRHKKKPRCCYWLKKEPVKRFMYENKADLIVTGEQASESYNRRLVFLQYGESFPYKKWSKDDHEIWKAIPLAIWQDGDVWDYLKREDLPVNPVYEKRGIDRTGCWTCTGFKGWEEKMRNFSEKLYQRAKREKDSQILLEAFM